jgi:hypothetical protein
LSVDKSVSINVELEACSANYRLHAAVVWVRSHFDAGSNARDLSIIARPTARQVIDRARVECRTPARRSGQDEVVHFLVCSRA